MWLVELVKLEPSRFLMTNVIRSWDTVNHFAQRYASGSAVPLPVVIPRDDSSNDVLIIDGHHRLVAQASQSTPLSAIVLYEDEDRYALYPLLESGEVIRGASNFDKYLCGHTNLGFLRFRAVEAHRNHNPGQGAGFTLDSYFTHLKQKRTF